MLVDDQAPNLKILEAMLRRQGHKVRSFPDGRPALASAASAPPDLILLDINMPEMDGYEVCARLKASETLGDIPVIFISAMNETMDKVRAFSVGGVDYVEKPFQFEEVQARVTAHLKLRRLQLDLQSRNARLEGVVREQVTRISESHMAMIFALAKLAESRDPETGKHLERVQRYCKLLSGYIGERGMFDGKVGPDFVEDIYHASPLHDIGKVGIPDRILQKMGKLTSEEFEVMKDHSELGARTLEDVWSRYPGNSFVRMGIEIARAHHEKWDGSGYPDHLAEDAIPLPARIMAVADIYDALTMRRCYKPAFSHERSCDIILESAGSNLDPEVVSAFGEIESQFSSVREMLHE